MKVRKIHTFTPGGNLYVIAVGFGSRRFLGRAPRSMS